VSDEDLDHAFQNRYGERRQAQVICWNKDDEKTALKQWDEARKGDTEFDRIARMQADPSLASATGIIAPLGKFPDVKDDTCTKVLYWLKEGEISQLFQTPAGVMCMKCRKIIPADPMVKLEGKLRETLMKEMWDKKLTAAIPDFFGELKKVAQPNLLLVGPPGPKEFREGVMQGIQQVSGVTPMTPPANPMPKP
jgi:PPIC-type PPIASE domain